MSLVTVVLMSAAILMIAYRTYGRLLTRLLPLNPQARTPAVELRDDVDYQPLEPNALLSQHFSAIAAAGPIVGPILAGVAFGWVPALIWILVGCIFIGGVHDFTALVASIRHKARSIAEVVRDHMSHRCYLLFLSFVWLALVYIIVAFTDITASSFVGDQKLENGDVVSGGGIATSSLLYLALPIIMGLLLKFRHLSLGMATVIFLPLVGVAIWLGQKLPMDMSQVLMSMNPELSATDARSLGIKVWDVMLLVYCCIASVVPMWLLLQPRGHLGGYFLYVALIGGGVGLIVGGEPIQYPQYVPAAEGSAMTIFPMLFITIACGACSGFHSLICSGTTSKQLRCEPDAKLIGYGAMLMEGMVAIVSLCCVMRLAQSAELSSAPKPNLIYAQGIGSFLQALSIPEKFGVSFALMAFTTFVYDTLDVCTRLGRYIIQELTGMHDRRGRWLGTILTAGVPAFFVTQTILDPATGKPQPIWKAFWNLFGASNQLLAALTLLGVTIWLWRTRRQIWVWFVTGIPTVLMYVMSTWALVRIISGKFKDGVTADPVGWIAIVLVGLAVLMLIEAVLILVRPQDSPPTQRAPAIAST